MDLATAPMCVSRIIPQSMSAQGLLKANILAGLSVKPRGLETLIVIGDKARKRIRASLASKMRCCAIEPMSCQALASFLADIQTCTAAERLEVVLKFAAGAMSGVGWVAFERRVIRIAGGWKPRNKFTATESVALDLLASDELSHVLNLLECLRRQPGVIVFRKELLSALLKTLKLVVNGEHVSLDDAAWHVQNKMRHAGRRLAQRSVGSTLLVKGLQFDHAIIVAPEELSRNDLYVALTRASRTITIVSAAPVLNAKPSPAPRKSGKK